MNKNKYCSRGKCFTLRLALIWINIFIIIFPMNSSAKVSAVLKRVRAEESRFKKKADDAFTAGRYEESLDWLQRAFEVNQNYRFIANKALVFKQMGRYKDAVSMLQLFISTNPATEKKARAQRMVNDLSPEIKFETIPSGAKVFLIDGRKALGITPFKRRIVAGEYGVRVFRSGYKEYQTDLIVTPGNPSLAKYRLEIKHQVPKAMPLTLKQSTGMDDQQRGIINTIAYGSGGGALLLSSISLLLGRSAIIDRNQARTSTQWDREQSAAELYHQVSLSTAILGVAIIAGTVGWNLFQAQNKKSIRTKVIRPQSVFFDPLGTSKAKSIK